MERMLTKKATAAGCTMEVTVMKLGEDFQICLAGGEKPHIGCVVQAVPRESLTGDGSWSATSSVWNRTGHKDDVLTLFVHLGYLAYDKKTREVFIPNKETLEICKRNSLYTKTVVQAIS